MAGRYASLAGYALLALQPAATAAAGATASGQSKVISLPISQKRNSSILYKRDAFAISLQNLVPFGEYFATVAVGTPPQEIELVLDTGSSDIWFFSESACAEVGCQGGSFDISASKSLKNIDNEGTFSIQYETANSDVRGQYISDTLSIGGVTVDGLTMAVATNVNAVFTGIMGVGLRDDESVTRGGHPTYVNFPLALKAQGQINTVSYSLYLDNLADSTGVLLFGGYDESKFHGDIVMLPLQDDSQSHTVTSFTVSFTSLGVSDGTGDFALETDGFVYPAVLDSGTTLTYLPAPLYNALFDYFNVELIQNGELALVDCNFGKKNPGSLVFGFGGVGGPRILVNFDEIAVPLYSPRDGSQYQLQNGELACHFGISQSGNGLSILFGQTFLRSAYVLYDLDNGLAGIAQTNFDETADSSVVEYDGSSGASQDRISTMTGGPSVTYGGGATASAPDGFFSSAFSFGPGSSAALSGGLASSVATDFDIASVAYPSNEAVPTFAATTIGPGMTGVIQLSSGTVSSTSGDSSSSSASGSSSTSRSRATSTSASDTNSSSGTTVPPSTLPSTSATTAPTSGSGGGSGTSAASIASSSPAYASAGALVVLIFTAMIIL